MRVDFVGDLLVNLLDLPIQLVEFPVGLSILRGLASLQGLSQRGRTYLDQGSRPTYIEKANISVRSPNY